MDAKELMNYTIFDFVGNLGVALIIGAYLLLQLERIRSDNLWYSIANLVGAALIIISLIVNFNLSAFIIEAFWVAISLIGIWRYFVKKKKAL